LVDVVDVDVGELACALFGDGEELFAVVGEFDALDGGQVVPCFEQFARFHFPHAHGAVGAAGREEGGGGVDIDGPEGALVAFVGAEALAVGAVPGADDMVFADGEEEVAFLGESAGTMSALRGIWWSGRGERILDLSERTLVAGKQYRSHVCCVVWQGKGSPSSSSKWAVRDVQLYCQDFDSK